MLDVVIRNGWVFDGTGNPMYRADVGIQEDRIVEVRQLKNVEAGHVIDATKKIISPGFIDSHSHTDWTIHTNPTVQSTIRQGITTEIVGNCGMGNAPTSDLSREYVAGRLREYCYEGPITWSTFADYLDAISQMGTSCNLAWFVGHSTIRESVGIGGSTESSDVTKEQMCSMENHVREAMEAGALGLSTGLEYEPGRLASTEEILRLAKVVGEYDGYYASHIRNYAESLQTAIEEFIEIVNLSGTRGQVSHLNVRYNTGAEEGSWQRAVETIEQARRDGLNIQTDCTGFDDGIGCLAAILPPWVRTGGPERTAKLLQDPEVRISVRNECDRYWRFIHRGEWDRVRIMQSKQFPEIAGKNFFEIADQWKKDVWDCYFDILVAAGSELDHLLALGLLFTEEHVDEMVRHPLFSLEGDIPSSSLDGPLRDKLPYRASYAGMIHFLTHHVREKHTLRLEDAIRKMTSMPATHFGLGDRGLIRTGCFADVVVFDYNHLNDVSVNEKPLAYAQGIEYVIVNGTLVVDNSEHTGARPGRNLLRSS
ncbi:MAG: D-aminoacylase [Bacteroidetes bacterium]|nr:D-aminoacylase [Bacteroidota bacterium]